METEMMMVLERPLIDIDDDYQKSIVVRQYEQERELYDSSPEPAGAADGENDGDDEDLTVQLDFKSTAMMMNESTATSGTATLPFRRHPTHQHNNFTATRSGSTEVTIRHDDDDFNYSARDCSNQARASSQPRALVSTIRVADPYPSLPLSDHRRQQRSVSQPRAAQRQHFLHGYNMESCGLDVRSIPDPPSPMIPNAAAKGSLEDVTNSQGSAMFMPLSSASSGQHALTHENQKKRKTNVDYVRPVDRDGTVYSLCLADEDHDEEESHIQGSPLKRQKRRQSVVLPDIGAFKASLLQSQKAHEQTKTRVMSPSMSFQGDMASMRELQKLVRSYCAKSHYDREDSHEVDAIRRITGYDLSGINVCNNDASAGIGSGQGVIGKMRQSQSTVLLASSRRLVMEKLGPVMADMERRKVEEKKKWEKGTGCRVMKSQRSGKYRYFCVSSNIKVSSQEYKRRYMAILDQEKPERELKALKWKESLKQQLDSCKPSGCEVENTRMKLTTSDCGQLERERDRTRCEEMSAETTISQIRHSVSWNQQESYSQIIHERDEMIVDVQEGDIQREAFLPPRNYPHIKKELSESSIFPASCHTDDLRSNILPIAATVSNSDFDEPAEISEMSSGDSEDSLKITRSQLLSEGRMVDDSPFATEDNVHSSDSSPPSGYCLLLDSGSFLDNQDTDEPPDGCCNQGEKSRMPKSTTSEKGLPSTVIPSRDNASADPDIAMAEKRLWDRIDEALRTYSREVMEIRSGKSGATGKPVTA